MSDRTLGISWNCDRLKLGGCERSLFGDVGVRSRKRDLGIIEKSCEIHAKLKAKGTPIQDADVNSSYSNCPGFNSCF